MLSVCKGGVHRWKCAVVGVHKTPQKSTKPTKTHKTLFLSLLKKLKLVVRISIIPPSIMPSPQQCAAANNIAAVFVQAAIRFAMLIARCQAGKTGAYLELINKMLREGMVTHAYILCGSNDTDLRNQAIKDATEANPEAFANGTIKVLFRQDFKTEMDITNAILVNDESHMDQTQNQELDVFLAKHGLSMDGNPKTLVEKNAFLVSVDATPYSELAALLHKESYPKHVESLALGDGYLGLADYHYAGLIRPTYDIGDAFSTMVRDAGKKYCLMRLTSGKHAKKQEAAAIAIYERLGGVVKYHTAEREEISVADLATAPEVSTLVIVRGRLRAGKVVKKEHIAFVWEGARISKTDALVQGLLGRMCGYDVPFRMDGDRKIPLIPLFVPASALKRHENKVMKTSEIERAIMEYPVALPTLATNLKKGHIANAASNGKTQCPPLRLTWDEEDDDWTFTEKYEEKFSRGVDLLEIKRRCCKLLNTKKNLDAIHNSSKYSAKQKAEILASIVTSHPSSSKVRNLEDKSQVDYFKMLREAHIRGHAVAENFGKCAPLNFAVTYKDYKAPHANRRHVYVIFYTDANNGAAPSLMSVDLKSRIPLTNGKSVFSIHDANLDRPIVAGGVVGFDESRIKTPDMLRSSLRDYMALWRDSGFTVARCIQSNKDRFTLQKGAFQYNSSEDNMVKEICRELSTEFGVKVKVAFTRSGDSTFNIKKISWSA